MMRALERLCCLAALADEDKWREPGSAVAEFLLNPQLAEMFITSCVLRPLPLGPPHQVTAALSISSLQRQPVIFKDRHAALNVWPLFYLN